MAIDPLVLSNKIANGRWRQLNSALLCLSIVSGYMSYRGFLAGFTDGPADLFTAASFAVLALAISIVIHLGWVTAFMVIPSQSGRAARAFSLGVLGLFLLLVIFVSAYPNVIAIAGQRASVHAMQVSVEEAAIGLAAAAANAERLEPFAAEFGASAAFYEERAATEARSGSSSGGAGSGTVTFALQDVSRRYAALAQSATEASAEAAARLDAARLALQDARRLLNADAPIEVRRAEMKASLDVVREAILALADPANAQGLLRGLEALPLEATNRPLTATSASGRAAQADALDRLAAELSALTEGGIAALESMIASEPPPPITSRLPTPAEAVVVHATAFAPAWAAGLALDLLPLVVLLFALTPRLFAAPEEAALQNLTSTTVGELLKAEDLLAALAGKDRDHTLSARLRNLHRARVAAAPDAAKPEED